MKRVRVRLGLPVSYARTPSGSSPLNALARLILSPNPSEPHTLKTLGLAQNTFQPGWYSKGRHVRTQHFIGLVFDSLVHGDFDIELSDWFLTIVKLSYPCFSFSNQQLHGTCQNFS